MNTFFVNQSGNAFLSNYMILTLMLSLAIGVCGVSLLFCLYRLLVGPTLADRIIALDACGITVMSLIVVYSLKQGTNLYMSAALVIAALGFIGVTALSKYLQSGNIVDNSDIINTAGGAVDGRYDPNRARTVDGKELRKQTKQQVKEVAANLGKDIKKDLAKRKGQNQEKASTKEKGKG